MLARVAVTRPRRTVKLSIDRLLSADRSRFPLARRGNRDRNNQDPRERARGPIRDGSRVKIMRTWPVQSRASSVGSRVARSRSNLCGSHMAFRVAPGSFEEMSSFRFPLIR